MKRNIDHLKTSEKLEELANLVEKVQPQHFNMNHWYKGEPSLELLLHGGTTECGTACCALGSAAVAFEGLELYGRSVWFNGDGVYYGVDAGAKFFGITMRESDRLFSPNTYYGEYAVQPVVVARIRQLAKKYRNVNK